MNVTEMSFVAAAAAAVASGKALPAIGQSPARFADNLFETGAEAPDRPGVFILTIELSGRAHPVYVGESESVIIAVSAVLAANSLLKQLTAGTYWLASPFALDRKRFVRELIEEYQPHFNVTSDAHVATSEQYSVPESITLDPTQLVARF